MRHNTNLSLLTVCCALTGCAITSPYWGYEPESITAPIPFQAWSPNTGALHIECADDTNGHGSPSDGEASYLQVATMTPSSTPSLDSSGAAVYSASKSVALPSDCWDWFGDYGFWQANVRVVMIDGQGKKVPFTSFDLDGLSCLGRETGKVGRWDGYVNKGCAATYTGTDTLIPYIVLRIDGYQNGLQAAQTWTAPKITPETRTKVLDGAKVAQIPKLDMKVGAVQLKR